MEPNKKILTKEKSNIVFKEYESNCDIINVFGVRNLILIVEETCTNVIISLHDDNKIYSKIKIKKKSKIEKQSIYFDNKTNILTLGIDNKLIKVKIKSYKIPALETIKTLKITLEAKEYITKIIKSSNTEYKGFWIITNINRITFIEMREVSGYSNLNKFWRVRTYTNRTSFDIPKIEIINGVLATNDSLYVASNNKLYRFCIIKTKLSLLDSIAFSSEISDSILYLIGSNLLIIGNSYIGSIIVQFDKQDFTNNTTYWCFSGEEKVKTKHCGFVGKNLVVVPKLISGIIDSHQIFFLPKVSKAFLVPKQNKSETVLFNNEFIISNFLTLEEKTCFLTKIENKTFIKVVKNNEIEIDKVIEFESTPINSFFISISNENLYLLSDKRLVIINEKYIT